jgi:hypothetical protein
MFQAYHSGNIIPLSWRLNLSLRMALRSLNRSNTNLHRYQIVSSALIYVVNGGDDVAANRLHTRLG